LKFHVNNANSETNRQTEIEKRHHRGVTRSVPKLKFLDATHGGAEIGHELFVVCSNDCLGLRFHPEVIEAAKKCMNDGDFGSQGAQLTAGAHPFAYQLE
jgi:7-keto-8-aminopelargonate synthetase-like enzyme